LLTPGCLFSLTCGENASRKTW